MSASRVLNDDCVIRVETDGPAALQSDLHPDPIRHDFESDQLLTLVDGAAIIVTPRRE